MSLAGAQFFVHNFRKSSGAPYAGVRVFHYAAGTLNAQDVWTDEAKVTPAAQPVVGDANGWVSFYADGSYRFQVKSSVADGDLLLFDWDNLRLIAKAATLRAESQGLSLPSAVAATRGHLFATIDANGDVQTFSIQKTASVWQNILFGNTSPGETIVFSKGADVASAATLNLGSDGNYSDVTGTVTVTGISTKPAGTLIALQFDAALILTHNATILILALGVNYTTVAGDVFLFISDGAGNWREVARSARNAASGGTGLSVYAVGDLLYASGTLTLSKLAAGGADTVLQHSGTAPFWGRGLLFHGPSSVGAGSTASHEGSFVSATGNLSGVHFYTNFTLDAAHTLTVPSGEHALVVYARDSITINGTITAVGAGQAGGAGGPANTNGSPGSKGTDQPGGGGGGGSGSPGNGAAGGAAAQWTTIVRQAGGAGGGTGNNNGSSGTTLTGNEVLQTLLDCVPVGGAGGGGGGGGAGADGAAGGAGGGTIILIAPIIILAATATLNTAGGAGTQGSVPQNSGSGGGGGAGNILIKARIYTDNGATFTQTGGAGGADPGASSGAGGAGAAGIKQILLYT